MTFHRSAIAPVAALLLLAACSSSGKTGTPSPSTVNINARQIALIRSATDDLLHACARRKLAAVEHHVTSRIRHQDWKGTCEAVAAHHMRVGAVSVTVHGDSATAHVRMTTDHGRLTGDLRWHRDHDGWHMSAIPSILTGAWDHDGHHWLGHVEHAAGHDDHTSTTVAGRHGDDHTSTTVTGHHEDDHTSTTVAGHHEDDHTSTSVAHHADDHTSTTVARHDDGHTSTTVATHHDD